MPKFQHRVGDIFDSGADMLVNPVNTKGIAGAGLAKEFSDRFPDMHEEYVARCFDGTLQMGQPCYVKVKEIDKWVCLFPTKDSFRDTMASELGIVLGLRTLANDLIDFNRFVPDHMFKSIAFPWLGCGLGRLPISAVKPMLVAFQKDVDIDVIVYSLPKRRNNG